MLPTIIIKVEGTELTVLVDTGVSASFSQIDKSKQNAIEIYVRNNTYQVCLTIG